MGFEVVGAEVDAAGAAPTVSVALRITAAPGQQVQSILLRCQVRIEPERRRYDHDEQARLLDLFGEPHRWSETVKPFQLSHITLPVRGFTDSTEVTLPLALSYDLEVGVGKYLHALRDGAVPLLLLFSGTVFHRAADGLQVEQIPWDREAQYDLPVSVWTAAIDAHYPGTGWLRLQRETIDALQAYKNRHTMPTWDDVVTRLLEEADVRQRSSGPLTSAPTWGNGTAARHSDTEELGERA